ncbi:MAG: hypothetical protein KDK36_15765 [Leptospiraceae bacterium]|nr:hypothetical protein [Leptospiraceae bacterium]
MILELDSLTMESVADMKQQFKGEYSEIEAIKINNFIDSSGLGILIEIAKFKIKNENKKLLIKGLTDVQKSIINLSKLDELFDIE